MTPGPHPGSTRSAAELRVVLEAIAELRRSRRLPELLRSAPEPGELADGVVTWAEFDEDAGARCWQRSPWPTGSTWC